MQQHRKILQALADGSLERFINESSEVDIDIFEELLSSGFVSAIDVCTLAEREYRDPKITLSGREYLAQLSAQEKEERKSWFRYGYKVLAVLASIATVVAAAVAVLQYFRPI